MSTQKPYYYYSNTARPGRMHVLWDILYIHIRMSAIHMLLYTHME